MNKHREISKIDEVKKNPQQCVSVLHVLPRGLYFPKDKSWEQSSWHFLRFSTMPRITLTELQRRKNAKHLCEHHFPTFPVFPSKISQCTCTVLEPYRPQISTGKMHHCCPWMCLHPPQVSSPQDNRNCLKISSACGQRDQNVTFLHVFPAVLLSTWILPIWEEPEPYRWWIFLHGFFYFLHSALATI